MTHSRHTTSRWWECPCGSEPPKGRRDATPIRTLISLREPSCVFCGRRYEHEYERASAELTAHKKAQTR